MDAKAARSVKVSIKGAVSKLPKNKKKSAGELADALLGGGQWEDLANQSDAALAEILIAATDALYSKKGRALAVEEASDGDTLVVLTMGNRPFIVDSVLGELSSHNKETLLVLHPRISTDAHGLTSLVVVKLDDTTAAERNAIKAGLRVVLDQVRQVTDDWQPMLARIGTTIAKFRTAPPPIPAEIIAEAVQFLDWLNDNNFTFLGMREYNFEGGREDGELTAVKGTALGILRDDKLAVMTRNKQPVVMTPEIRDFLFSPNPLIIMKANLRSKVHRQSHLDYIGIKRYTKDGKLAGELRVVGLFTSTAYTKSVMTIPVLRHKANAVIDAHKTDLASHTGKALVNILETWPRDELFQLDIETLTEFSALAAALEERPRIRVLSRPDRFDRFVSTLVFVPRDRYDSNVRIKVGEYLAQVYEGYLSAFFPVFLENGLTRVHFIIGRNEGKTPAVDRETLEAEVAEIVRTWSDRLAGVSKEAHRHHFPIAYQEAVSPQVAVADHEHFDGLVDDQNIAVSFEDEKGEENGRVTLKLFHLNTAVPLSRRVPMLENMGFQVIEESTFEITRADDATVFLHAMQLQSDDDNSIDLKICGELLRQTLLATWSKEADNDAFNALVLATGMGWRLASVFRAYAGYLRQIRSRFTPTSMARTLVRHSEITAELAKLFTARFDPSAKAREKKQEAAVTAIEAALEMVQSSDDDRIIRNFQNLIQATLRTNFYRGNLNNGDGSGTEVAPAPVLAFKVDPDAVNIMPQPVPYREIFVSSPRVEGLHLRFGPVARGGLRWSDRAQDYRTEVLGLVKAQQVKNAVIVPVGSKGGFLPKHLPDLSKGGDRNEWFEEGRAAYKVFIASLLSLTDNLIDGKIDAPKGVVRHDGDDPYFVVAADKGTSTFSDTANAISQELDFWLDDAFASGGSAGYDHKKMGITARGGWEAVKRHFREMDKDGKSWDIQSEPFSVVGVGDMSGDVFGNGMLLSRKTRLIAAFDHRDIFIDPDPDIASSFKERKRLFDAGRSSWQDYNTKQISKGGAVYSRALKSLKLSRESAKAIGLQAGDHTPQEVMNAILKADVDLLWFGGIGTYVRATHESDADADDRANDAIRVTAKQLRCKVIGEGANLGVTQPARIEFNMRGGCCNSDAVDNSAGVNSSDVEVNIKIALASAMKAGRLTRPKRNKLLESMTDKVADLVLRNNYLQTLAISLTERRGMEDFPHQQRLMQSLEARDLLDRAVEDLPDDVSLAERQSAGKPLTRAEVGVLLAYAKIVALDDLVASDVLDDPYLKDLLIDYFPPKMHKGYMRDIEGHRLRREIIGTVLANSMINRGGPSFINRVSDRTGARVDLIARAYVAVRDAFAMPQIQSSIDALDAKISGDLQLELYDVLRERVISQTVWFARYGDFSKGIGAVATDYAKAVKSLMPKLEKITPGFLARRIDNDAERYTAGGVPKDLARTIARLPIAGLIPDILYASKQSGQSLEKAATVFFALTETFRIGRMVQAASEIETQDYYDGLALDRALQSLHMARRDIIIDVLKSKGDADKWLETKDEAVSRTRSQMAGIVEGDQATVSRLTVAANILADLARS